MESKSSREHPSARPLRRPQAQGPLLGGPAGGEEQGRSPPEMKGGIRLGPGQHSTAEADPRRPPYPALAVQPLPCRSSLTQKDGTVPEGNFPIKKSGVDCDHSLAMARPNASAYKTDGGALNCQGELHNPPKMR